jgi:hypothetical protein
LAPYKKKSQEHCGKNQGFSGSARIALGSQESGIGTIEVLVMLQ